MDTMAIWPRVTATAARWTSNVNMTSAGFIDERRRMAYGIESCRRRLFSHDIDKRVAASRVMTQNESAESRWATRSCRGG